MGGSVGCSFGLAELQGLRACSWTIGIDVKNTAAGYGVGVVAQWDLEDCHVLPGGSYAYSSTMSPPFSCF